MWDKPNLLNAIANTLFGAAFFLILVMAVLWGIRQPAFAVREVRVTQRLVHVTPEQIEAVVKSEIDGNFFTLDLARARAGFEKLPWVRVANVRRQWPARLEVVLEEHVPLAHWNTDLIAALVNTHGEVFDAAYDQSATPLPTFSGPDGSAQEITQQYDNFRRSLVVLGRAPQRIDLSSRRAWRLQLDTGLVIELGREQIEARMERFITAYPRIVAQLSQVPEYVDLRYPNGFAVRVRDGKALPNHKVSQGEQRWISPNTSA
jgi:cell division protein FtsQ